MSKPTSPFKAATAVSFPVGKLPGNLVIRLDNDDLSNRAIISIQGTVDAAHANFYIMGGESIEISKDAIIDGSLISILSTVNDADIYWGYL